MINQTYVASGKAEAPILDIYEYGKRQAEKIGADKVYDFCIGNPSIPTPRAFHECVEKLIDTRPSVELHSYTAEEGPLVLRKAICENLKRRFGLELRPERILTTCGATSALIAIGKALVDDPKDEIMVVAPYFTEYKLYFDDYSGGKMSVVPPDTENWQIRFDEMEKLLNEHTMAVVINSPNNPTGVIYSEETLKKLAAMLEKKSKEYGHPIYLVSDEPYREIVYDGETVPFTADFYKNTLICYSWSKCLSIPGERVGFCAIPDSVENGDELYLAIHGALRDCGYLGVGSLMQLAVAECIDMMPNVEAYRENRDLLWNALIEYGYECYKPKGAFYLFVKVPSMAGTKYFEEKGSDSKAWAEKAKIEQNVLVAPGDSYGCPGYVRVSTCVDPEMIKRSLPSFKALA